MEPQIRREYVPEGEEPKSLYFPVQPNTHNLIFDPRHKRNSFLPTSYLDDVPKYGFGTTFDVGPEPGQMSEDQFKNLIIQAVRLGCRHFDCAPIYMTQSLVGEALKKALCLRYVRRKQLFITSKLPPNMMRPEHIERSIRKSLSELKLDYVDLFLLHAPFSTKHVSDDDFFPTDRDGNLLLDLEDSVLENAWLKMIDLKQLGLCKYIGVSNVNLRQLMRLNSIFQVDVVQNEYHLYNQDHTLFDYCREVDVHFEAYAVFGSPEKARAENRPCVFDDRTLNSKCGKHKLTPAQILIQWVHQQPVSYVIKTDTIEQLKENLQAASLPPIDMDDMIELDGLNQNSLVHTFEEHKGIRQHPEYPFNDEPPIEIPDDDLESSDDDFWEGTRTSSTAPWQAAPVQPTAAHWDSVMSPSGDHPVWDGGNKTPSTNNTVTWDASSAVVVCDRNTNNAAPPSSGNTAQ